MAGCLLRSESDLKIFNDRIATNDDVEFFNSEFTHCVESFSLWLCDGGFRSLPILKQTLNSPSKGKMTQNGKFLWLTHCK